MLAPSSRLVARFLRQLADFSKLREVYEPTVAHLTSHARIHVESVVESCVDREKVQVAARFAISRKHA